MGRVAETILDFLYDHTYETVIWEHAGKNGEGHEYR